MNYRKNVRMNNLFDSVRPLDVQLKCSGHGGRIGEWRFDVKPQPGVPDCLRGRRSEGCYTGIVLFEFGKVGKEGVDSGRTEKCQNIVKHIFQVTEICCDCMIHDCL